MGVVKSTRTEMLCIINYTWISIALYLIFSVHLRTFCLLFPDLRIRRQHSSESMSSINSAASHSSMGSLGKDAEDKKKKKKSWVGGETSLHCGTKAAEESPKIDPKKRKSQTWPARLLLWIKYQKIYKPKMSSSQTDPICCSRRIFLHLAF